MTLENIYASLKKRGIAYRTYVKMNSENWMPPMNKEHQMSRRKKSELDQTLCHYESIGYLCRKGFILIDLFDDNWMKITFQPGITQMPKWEEAGFGFVTISASPENHGRAFKAIQAVIATI